MSALGWWVTVHTGSSFRHPTDAQPEKLDGQDVVGHRAQRDESARTTSPITSSSATDWIAPSVRSPVADLLADLARAFDARDIPGISSGRRPLSSTGWPA
jgi:hypothetical protein